MALSRKFRLPIPEFFAHTRTKRAHTIAFPWGTLKIIENSLGCNRIAVVAGAKVHPLAVKRNMLKRMAISRFEQLPPCSMDILITFAPLAGKEDKQILSRALHDAVTTIHKARTQSHG